MDEITKLKVTIFDLLYTRDQLMMQIQKIDEERAKKMQELVAASREQNNTKPEIVE